MISLEVIGNIHSEIVFIIFRNLIFCSMLYIFVLLYKKGIKYILSNHMISHKLMPFITLIVLLTLIVFYMNIFAMSDKSSFINIASNLWIFIVYLILITVLFALMLRLSIKQYKIKQKEKENENFELYVKSLEQANNDMRKFRHDYVNILSTLRAYIDEGDNAGLKEYFNNHILATQQKVVDHNLTLGRLNNLGIKGIKGLLTTKIIQAQEKQVEIDLEITEQVKFINMDTIELNRVLGILLDNAIEASINQSGPMIRVAFINLEASILIVVLNKITNPAIKVHEIYREGYSTKGPNRGVGLSILKEIVSRSEHITLNTRIDDHYFIQELEIKERNIKNGSYHM
ncbi:signal transduction protein [Priestia filamentosa]|nr:signal transduction protein [Priestia filamentosa]